MDRHAFVDTNILVYTYDTRAAEKRKTATELLESLIVTKRCVLSTQVVQEFCNVAVNKIKHLDTTGLQHTLTRVIMPLVSHSPSKEFYLRAIDLHAKHSLNFYDALIVQAALDLDCSLIYSEDLQDGQQFGELKVVNPFKKEGK